MGYNKGKHQKEIYSALFPALAVSMGLGIVMFLMGSVYETSDDWYLASQLSSGFRGTFLSPMLSKLFIWLYAAVHQLPWWSLFLFACGCGTLFLFLYCSFRRATGWGRVLPCMFWTAAVWICFVSKLQIIRTTFAVSIAGGLLLYLSCTCDKKHPIARTVEWAAGIVCVALGFMMRPRVAMMLALVFLILYGAYLFCALKKQSLTLRTQYKEPMGMLIAALLIGALTLGGYSIGSDAAWKDYHSYDQVLGSVQNDAENYPKWEDAQLLYEKLGLSENDVELLLHQSFSEDTNIFDKPTLQAMSALHQPKTTMGTLARQLLSSRMSALVLASFLLVGTASAATTRSLGWWIAGVVSSLLCCALLGRTEVQVVEPILFCMVAAAFLLLKGHDPHEQRYEGRTNFVFQKTIRAGTRIETVCKKIPIKQLLAQCFCVLAVISAIWPTAGKLHIPTAQDGRSEEVVAKTDYFNGTRDRVYLLPLTAEPWHQVTGTWRTFPLNYCQNVFFLGGWAARSPENIERLAETEIVNPLTSLFENTKVYTLYDEQLLNYVSEHYGKKITCTAVEPFSWIDSSPVIKLTAPVTAFQTAQKNISATVEQFYQYGSQDIWYLKVRCENEFDRLYCNVQLGETTYSFLLEKESADVHSYQGFFYGLSALCSDKVYAVDLIGDTHGKDAVWIGSISSELKIG